MTIAKISAFESAAAAAKYSRSLEDSGFEATITGPLDIVLIDKPGSAIDGWSEAGKTWYVVVGSQKPFTAVK